jgi:GNAT superfamily N-acetyltransferase
VLTITEVDPHDETLLRAFWDNEQAAQRAARHQPVLRTYAALAATTRDPSPYHRRALLAALDGDDLVGGVDVSWSVQDNTHLGEVEVNVRPDRWRQGIGRLLHDAALDRLRAESRTTVIGEACEGPEGDGPAVPFATALGYVSSHLEHHLVLSLPAEVEALPPDDAYSVVTWADRCPDEHVAAYVAMRNQMETDVPMGDLDLQPVLLDEERVRVSEARTAKTYRRLVAAAVDPSGGMVGYSELFLPHGETYVQQDDTLVMPDHRGHRLGLRLKQANLETVQREHPERDAVHTWTAPGNVAMIRTNERFGFTVVERMHEMQRKI